MLLQLLFLAFGYCIAVDKQGPQTGGDVLFVVGGVNAEFRSEFVDLSGLNRSCPAVPDYPGAAEGSSGTFFFNDGVAMVCGGGFRPTTAECFAYDNGGNWVKTPQELSEPRAFAASVHLSPSEWWITGGQQREETKIDLSSTEVMFEGFLAPYAELPANKAFHNMIRVNETHFVLVGGYSNMVWLYDRTTAMWRDLPPLTETRYEPQAGLVRYADGTTAVVVAGGVDSMTSEIMDMENLVWRRGPDLSVTPGLYGGASVQLEDTFLVVGGTRGAFAERSILELRAETVGAEEWVELEEKMKDSRVYFAAFMVPNEFAGCVA